MLFLINKIGILKIAKHWGTEVIGLGLQYENDLISPLLIRKATLPPSSTIRQSTRVKFWTSRAKSWDHQAIILRKKHPLNEGGLLNFVVNAPNAQMGSVHWKQLRLRLRGRKIMETIGTLHGRNWYHSQSFDNMKRVFGIVRLHLTKYHIRGTNVNSSTHRRERSSRNGEFIRANARDYL